MELVLLVTLLPFVLAVAATVGIVRTGGPLGVIDVAWLLLVWLVPVVGPLVWFVAGRRSQAAGPP